MTRENFIQEVTAAVMVDRNDSYGDPEDNFQAIGELHQWFDKWTGHYKTDTSLGYADLAVIYPIFIKLARFTKTPRNVDNLIDLAGYAACAAEVLGAE